MGPARMPGIGNSTVNVYYNTRMGVQSNRRFTTVYIGKQASGLYDEHSSEISNSTTHKAVL